MPHTSGGMSAFVEALAEKIGKQGFWLYQLINSL